MEAISRMIENSDIEEKFNMYWFRKQKLPEKKIWIRRQQLFWYKKHGLANLSHDRKWIKSPLYAKILFQSTFEFSSGSSRGDWLSRQNRVSISISQSRIKALKFQNAFGKIVWGVEIVLRFPCKMRKASVWWYCRVAGQYNSSLYNMVTNETVDGITLE